MRRPGTCCRYQSTRLFLEDLPVDTYVYLDNNAIFRVRLSRDTVCPQLGSDNVHRVPFLFMYDVTTLTNNLFPGSFGAGEK